MASFIRTHRHQSHITRHSAELSGSKKSLRSRRVTAIEAERLEETREEREAFLRNLRTEIERQAAEKHVTVHLPDDKPSAPQQH